MMKQKQGPGDSEWKHDDQGSPISAEGAKKEASRQERKQKDNAPDHLPLPGNDKGNDKDQCRNVVHQKAN